MRCFIIFIRVLAMQTWLWSLFYILKNCNTETNTNFVLFTLALSSLKKGLVQVPVQFCAYMVSYQNYSSIVNQFILRCSSFIFMSVVMIFEVFYNPLCVFVFLRNTGICLEKKTVIRCHVYNCVISLIGRKKK